MTYAARMSVAHQTTQLLNRLCRGDRQAGEELTPLLIEELRRLARKHLRGHPAQHTLNPTALVNEAYLKLVQLDEPDWKSRAHFFSVASRAMRSLLVDYLREKRAAKRGGGAEQLTLQTWDLAGIANDPLDILAVNDALEQLFLVNRELGELAELRLFGGLTGVALCEALNVSRRTAERRWKVASVFLRKQLIDD